MLLYFFMEAFSYLVFRKGGDYLGLLEVKNIDFSYGRIPILKNICFELDKAQIWVLLGPNGSGKSTLLRCLSGLNEPHSGHICIEGRNLKKFSRKQLARHICFLPQKQMELQYTSVYELVAMGRSPHQSLGWCLTGKDKEKINWAIEYMKLTGLQKRLLSSLSGGERQRAWIAMILVQDTPVILLDEPATFLDLKYQWDLIAKIHDIRRQLQKSFVIVLHDVNQAFALADQVLVLKDGQVYQSGNPAEVITSQLLQDVYSIEANVCRIPQHSRPVVIPKAIC